MTKQQDFNAWKEQIISLVNQHFYDVPNYFQYIKTQLDKELCEISIQPTGVWMSRRSLSIARLLAPRSATPKQAADKITMFWEAEDILKDSSDPRPTLPQCIANDQRRESEAGFWLENFHAASIKPQQRQTI